MRNGGDELNDRLVRSVPDSARTILQVGAGQGWLATGLKRGAPDRVVYGIDLPHGPHPAVPADLDDLFELEITRSGPPLGPGSVDCIIYADALSRLTDPLAVLELHRPLLSPTGTISCSVPNLQHHEIVTQLLRGTFRYDDTGLIDSGHVHLFTYSGIVQLLLDAGYAPNAVDTSVAGGTEEMIGTGSPLFEFLGLGVHDLDRQLRTPHMLFTGQRMTDVESEEEEPLTFVACVNDDAQLEANLLSSPCLNDGDRHEVLIFRGCASAAEGLNAGIEKARHDLVVLVHQDVYIPKGWPARMVSQWRRLQGDAGAGTRAGAGAIGVAGVFGVKDRRVPFDSIGKVVHRDRMLSSGEVPAEVDGLDEVLMVVQRDTPLRFDSAVGWHLYGTDIALQAQQQGMRTVVLDAPCHHNTLANRVPSQYRESERALARKWRELLPIHTNLSSIGSWLLDGPSDAGAGLADDGQGDGAAHSEGSSSMARVVQGLQGERAALSVELERARLEVASMQASPFWRARDIVVGWRDRLKRRR